MRSTHRLSYEVFKGDPGRLMVLHNCDTRACVNPDHLRLGTHRDNMRDGVKRRRFACRKGEQNSNAKVTDAQVNEIRTRFAAGEIQTALAKEYGLSTTTMHVIVTRKRWQHLWTQEEMRKAFAIWPEQVP